MAHPELSDPERWWEHLLPTFVRAYRGIGVEETAAEELAFKFRSRYLDPAGWTRYPDVLPTFSALTRRGWRHRIITNHVPEFPFILSSLGLSGLIDHVTNSAEIGYEKPHPEIFRLAPEAVGNPTSAWMVGDNVTADILGAEQAGISGTLVWRVDPRARWNCHGLEEVLTIIP